MDNVTPVPAALQSPAAVGEIAKIKRSRGRPHGARNYSGVSIIARSMKEKGLYWVNELIDSYSLYKKQLGKYIVDPTLPQPNPDLLQFWMTILPYITVKMIERTSRREKPAAEIKRRKVRSSDLEALARAEGR